ncbi:MAG: hypothetical protein H7A01_08675 [Hahellaceae bacterium]|nr:hypothetical protein [Hahellaceae bacterium]MCP5211455.1 hypothetical protein [Hahellaceae bacterium]
MIFISSVGGITCCEAQSLSRTQGVLMAMTHRKLVKPGDLIAKIAGQSPLEHRQEGNLLQL